MLRFVLFLLAVAASAYAGYRAAPEPTFTPALVTITACTPNVVVGYVLIAPDKAPNVYVGGISAMTSDAKQAANDLYHAGKMNLGLLHFKGPALCAPHDWRPGRIGPHSTHRRVQR